MLLFQRYNAGYIQDDWRITSKLTLNLGFRYEYTSPYGEKSGAIGYFDPNDVEPLSGLKGLFKWVPPGGYHSDPNYKTWGPRVGLAYQLNAKTVIRAGSGIFNSANNGLNAAATDFGTGLFTTNALSLGAPNPIQFTPPVGGSWSNPFAAGFVFPEKGITTFVGQNIRVDFKDHPLAYLANWTFSVQRQINANTLAEVAYVGTKTTHLFWNRMDNANNPLLLDQWGSHLLDVVPNPFFGKIQGGVGAFPTIQQRQLLRPFPQYQQILAVRRPYGDASYQSMTGRLEKSYSRGFTISLAYTLSKLIASTAESNSWVIGPSNALYNPGYNRGLDANDTPHRLVISHVWDLPFGIGRPHLSKGIAARVLGNWQFSGITVLQAGRPILISAPDNTNLLDFSYTNGRADRLHSAVIDHPTKTQWFDITAFRAAAPFTVPTDSLSQPDLRTPWRNAWNWSFFKNNPIKERYNVQFRAEFYNIFNTPQFDVLGNSTSVTSPLFGQIVEGGGNRNIQFGIRVVSDPALSRCLQFRSQLGSRTLVIAVRRDLPGGDHAPRRRDLALPSGPAFPLAATVSVGFLRLIVKQNLICRVRQVDAIFGELLLDGRERRVARVEHIFHPRRRHPPPRPHIHAVGGEFHHQRLRLRIVQNILRGNQRFDDEFARQPDIVAVADRDVVLQAPYRERRVHGHLIGEEFGVGDHHAPIIVGLQECRARLDLLHRALEPSRDDLIPDMKRMSQQQQNSCQEILKNVAERESHRDAANAEHLDEIAGFERRQRDGRGHQ
jgi:hypothetical protein